MLSVVTCQGMNLPPSCRAWISAFKATAAGHFHARQGNRLDGVAPQDLSQFVSVIDRVKLGAADQGDLVFHKAVVEISMGIGGAVAISRLAPSK